MTASKVKRFNILKNFEHILFTVEIIVDERLLYKQSEVALDFNAGFQSCTVGVLHHLIIGKASDNYQVTRQAGFEYDHDQPQICLNFNKLD